jgi:hypothetical protein
MLSAQERAKIVGKQKKEAGISVDVNQRFNDRNLDPKDGDFEEEESKSN